MKPLVTLSGISCSGKTVLAEYASQKVNDDFIKIITSTTRPARAGEHHGIDYNFLSKPEFIRSVENGRFLEHEIFGDNYYGTSMDELDKSFATGKLPFAVVEPNGANTIRARGAERGIAVLNVFIDCPVEVALERWYERYLINVSKKDPQTEFFAKRISTTIAIEPYWRNACDYHLVLPYGSNERDTIKQLESIKDYAEENLTPTPTTARSKDTPQKDISRIRASVSSLLDSQPDKNKFIRLAIKIAGLDKPKENCMVIN